MAIAVMLNNFMHDFCAAGWVVGMALLWTLTRKVPQGAAVEALAAEMLKTLLLTMRLSAAGIVVFGVVRAIAYRQYEWSSAAGDGQILLLGVKHVLLTVVFFWGLRLYLKARRILRRANA